jgi:hypothetical protein
MKRLISILALLACGPMFGQGVPFGEEFRVNTDPAAGQEFPAVAALADGGFVVCWHQPEQDGSFGIFCQRFDDQGWKAGAPFRANSYSPNTQWDPATAGLANGGFVVGWGSDGQDGSEYGIFGQCFDADGHKKGGEFRMNTYTHGIQDDIAFSPRADGGFVACWQDAGQDGSDYGCYGQMFNAEGAKEGGEFQVNNQTDGLQGDAVPAFLSNGEFVVCWTDRFTHISGRLFDAGAKPAGESFIVSRTQGYPQWWVAVAPLNQGIYTVLWNVPGESGYDVWGRIFYANGAALTDDFMVNTTVENNQWKPAVAPLPDGGFVACWQSYGQDGSSEGIFGQLFDKQGNRRWGEFSVNTFTAGSQDLSTVAGLPDGGFVVCWESDGQDGSGYGIFGKRFPAPTPVHPLQAFGLVEPSNDASVGSGSILFQWRQPGSVRECYPWELTFDVAVDTEPGFGNPRIVRAIQDTSCMVESLEKGRTYFWKVLAKNAAGDSLWSSETNGFFIRYDRIEEIESSTAGRPDRFTLHPNHPNPFNPDTVIRFDLQVSGSVRLAVYDINGRSVRTLVEGMLDAGSCSMRWDGREQSGALLPSGIYICRMEVRSADGRGFVQSVKMVLVR